MIFSYSAARVENQKRLPFKKPVPWQRGINFNNHLALQLNRPQQLSKAKKAEKTQIRCKARWPAGAISASPLFMRRAKVLQKQDQRQRQLARETVSMGGTVVALQTVTKMLGTRTSRPSTMGSRTGSTVVDKTTGSTAVATSGSTGRVTDTSAGYVVPVLSTSAQLPDASLGPNSCCATVAAGYADTTDPVLLTTSHCTLEVQQQQHSCTLEVQWLAEEALDSEEARRALALDSEEAAVAQIGKQLFDARTVCTNDPTTVAQWWGDDSQQGGQLSGDDSGSQQGGRVEPRKLAWRPRNTYESTRAKSSKLSDFMMARAAAFDQACPKRQLLRPKTCPERLSKPAGRLQPHAQNARCLHRPKTSPTMVRRQTKHSSHGRVATPQPVIRHEILQRTMTL